MRDTPTIDQDGGTNFFRSYFCASTNNAGTEYFDGFTADQLNTRSTGLFTNNAGNHCGKVARALMANAGASIAFDAEF